MGVCNMQTKNRLFDDIAKVANSAVSTFAGLKGEIENMVQNRIENLMTDMNMISRDEFEAVKGMIAKARSEQERLETKVKELEKKLTKSLKPTPQKKRASTKNKPPRK